MRDTGATWYSAVPTIHNLLLSRAGNERPEGAEGLRFIRSCSASLPAEMMAQMERVFGAPVLEAYGMTEASHQMSSNPLPPPARKPGSVGPGTGVKIGIMDDAGNLLPAGERGEVVIQGPNVVSGYENNPEANAKSFTNGWFRTGDQGFLDADGYLTLTGRIKELINRGGEKIGPREIDEVLLAHPAVAEAVCFGVPHPAGAKKWRPRVVLKEGVTTEAADLGVLQRAAGRLQAAEEDSHHRRRFRARRPARSSAARWRRRSREPSRADSRADQGNDLEQTNAISDRRRGRHRRLHRRAAWRAPGRTSRCSRAARICGRCRSTGCASSARTAISKSHPRVDRRSCRSAARST